MHKGWWFAVKPSTGRLQPLLAFDLLDLFAKVAPGAAALGAALVAWSGLGAWKKQLRGKESYELARRVLRAVLKSRDEIRRVRAPMMLAGEIGAAYEAAGVPRPVGLEGAGGKGEGLVYQQRWNALASQLTELEAELIEAEVLWGSALREPNGRLRRCTGELYSALVMTMRARAESRHDSQLALLAEKNFRILYEISSESDPDEFGKRIDEIVQTFERLLRPHLSLDP